jgi:hypothetical protein
MWKGKRGVVFRTTNENILGLKKSEAIMIYFEDGSRKMLMYDELSECMCIDMI